MLNIYLPGYSSKNNDDVEQIAKVFKKSDLHLYARRWDNWFDESLVLKPDWEAEMLERVVKQVSRKNFGIIAKSIGTVVAMQLLQRGNLPKPKYLVLMGVPLTAWAENNVSSSLITGSDYTKQNLLFIQNDNDPVNNSSQIGEYILKNNVDADLLIKQADNHIYHYWDDIMTFVSQFN